MFDLNERVGEVLLSKGIITRRQLEQALNEQRDIGKPLGEVLLKLGVITQNDLDENLRELVSEQLINQLHVMFDMEMVISDFYYMCAEHYPDAAAFWQAMGNDEVRHALSVGKIIEAVYGNPKAFGAGYSDFLSEIERVIELVRAAYRRVKNDKIPLDETLLLSHNFEDAMMESRVFELFSTSTPEAHELLDALKRETQGHMKKLVEAYSST